MQAHGIPRPQLEEKTYEAYFDRFFDKSTGKRRLTCQSRDPVPEDPEQGDRALAYQRTYRCAHNVYSPGACICPHVHAHRRLQSFALELRCNDADMKRRQALMIRCMRPFCSLRNR